MYRLISLLLGYCFGCLQSAYFIGKRFKKIDIREHGSGNAGTTNVIRVMGAKAGAFVFFFDIAKAMLAFAVASLIFDNIGACFIGSNYSPGIYAGLGTILGHNFPFYLKFKGGKGVACTIGTIAIFDIRVALLCFGIAYIFFHFTKYISVGSLFIVTLFPIMLIIFSYNPEICILGAAVTVLCFYQHRANIKRLISGTENKFSLRKKSDC